MLFYATYVSALLALYQIAASPIDSIESQSLQGNDQQNRLLDPAFPREPAPVYEYEVLLDNENAPIASYSPVLANRGPVVNDAASTNYGNLANQQSVLVYRKLEPVTHSETPLHHAAAQPIAQEQDYDGAPHYEFSYSVDDDHTGDHKSQHETRHGDVVTGEYRLRQPDGSERRVKYSADQHSGFNAIVHNSAPTNPQVVDSHNV